MKNKMLVVLKYEFKKLVCSKGFIIGTILGPFAILAIMGISAYFGASSVNTEEKVSIAFVKAGDNNAADAVAGALQAAGWTVTVVPSADGLDAKVFNKEINGYCVADADYAFSYYAEDTGDLYIMNVLDSVVSECVVSCRLADAGIDPLLVQQLSAGAELKTFKLSADADDVSEADTTSDYLIKLFVPLVFSMMIYMTLLLYGTMIGRSIVTEKSSKIVDVLISSVKPTQLLLGKLLGVGLGGLLQYSIWMLFGIIGVKVTNLLSLNISIPFIDFVYLTVFFLLGYVLYGSCYAAIGSASEDEQHMSQLSGPLIMCLIIPIVFVTGIIQNPDSTLALVLSLFPLTSPMIMLTRLIQGGVPAWQFILCIALLLGSIWLIIKMSAKIFRIGIMKSGQSFGFKDMKLWLKAKE